MRKTESQMIIDAHCHLAPPLTGGQLVQSMNRAKVDKAVCFPSPSA